MLTGCSCSGGAAAVQISHICLFLLALDTFEPQSGNVIIRFTAQASSCIFLHICSDECRALRHMAL